MKLVAGVDSSTQSCKVMIRDLDTGALVRAGIAKHRAGTEVSASVWREAFELAVQQAGGLDDVVALSVAGQQHGLVTLDSDGNLVRDAILWNDTKAAKAAQDLVEELGGGETGGRHWAEKTGSVPVASFTVAKLRWLADNEPENLRKVAAAALPHDWLSWQLNSARADKGVDALFTDRSDASGTGYFDAKSNQYDRELLALALKDDAKAHDLKLPDVLAPAEAVPTGRYKEWEFILGPGAGDNAAAALGLDLVYGELAMSIGTSGVVSLASTSPVEDASGLVAGFADARGGFLPLACTLNASRVVDGYAQALGVSHEEFSELALSAPPGAEGLICIPYLEGERTPNLPFATGSLLGVNLSNLTRPNIARAVFEGVLCGIAEGIDAMRDLNVPVDTLSLVGGGAQSKAMCKIAPEVLGMPVKVPEHGEYVADGAARQAAWAYLGGAEPPQWTPRLHSEFEARHYGFIVERFREANSLYVERTK